MTIESAPKGRFLRVSEHAARHFSPVQTRSRWLLAALAVLGVLGSVLGAAGALADGSGSGLLPDGRAWEQVSPADKNGNGVNQEIGTMASLDGNRLLYHSLGAFAGVETSIYEGLWYMANRTPSGWRTVSQMPSGGTFTFGFNGYQGFTEDLSKGVLAWREDQITGGLDPQAPLGSLNLYLRDASAGTFELLNGLDTVGETNGFVWGSRDFGKLALQTSGHLTADSPCTGFGVIQRQCAYEWDHGELRLASVLPDGTPVDGAVGNAHHGNYEHALSDDGRRLFFESPFTGGNGGAALYVREDGTTTVPISGSERTLPGGASGGPVRYQSAEAAHGDRVLFSTRNSLVDTDTDATNDLYLYDFTKPEGQRLALVSQDLNPEAPQGADVNGGNESGTTEYGGVVGASEDLHRVYFAADNQIVPGAPEAPGPKLFLWEDTGGSPTVHYIATLKGPPSPDESLWTAPSIGIRDGMRTSRISRNGRFLAFATDTQVSSFDNEGRQEVYLYDALSDTLECISCVEGAFPAEGPIGFQVSIKNFNASPLNHRPSNVTDSGQVFFETTRGLVPRDSNGRYDVYEYENGELHLISRGTGGADSYFLDATPSGSDVFFTTSDRLVGWDTDNNYDAYDARKGGGLPEPPPPTPPCGGDACQSPPQAPAESSLASESFQGSGNVSARKPKRPRCAGTKVRRQGKCQKRHRAGRPATRKEQR